MPTFFLAKQKGRKIASGHKTINPTYKMFIGRVFHIDERRSAFPSPQSAEGELPAGQEKPPWGAPWAQGEP